ncbi:hypothetical protein M6D81_19310 [Paenibacillus sp. J5C_2022]|nr:hypothetical protein [Paenibacillus sp. J5C2022]
MAALLLLLWAMPALGEGGNGAAGGMHKIMGVDEYYGQIQNLINPPISLRMLDESIVMLSQ